MVARIQDIRHTFSPILILLLAFGLLLPADALAKFSNLPSGFADEDFASGVPNPTAFDWLPDGKMLITSKQGGLFRADSDGQNLTALTLPIAVCSDGERGLLGIAVDPDFNETGFVFLYYTASEGSDCVNRVSRFSLSGTSLSLNRVLVDGIASPASNHNGGDLQFDRNELLYLSVGDGGQDLRTGAPQGENGNARRLDVLNGKILRVNRDGSIPASNPFTGPETFRCSTTELTRSASGDVSVEKKSKKQKRKARKRKRKQRQNQQPKAACQEIFATGLRNPFRIAFDPDDRDGAQRFYINDVGGGAWEEINAGQAGADYGWNIREGPCRRDQTSNCKRDKRFVSPLHAYKHETANCRSITGGAFVPNDGGDWPNEFNDSYIFADFVCDKLFRLRTTGNGVQVQQFGEGETTTYLAFGPDGSLYYTDFFDGQVRRITHTPP